MELRAYKALCGAAVCGLMLVVINYAAFHIGAVERLDADVFNGFGSLRYHGHVQQWATSIANLCDARPYTFLCCIPLGIALQRRRWEIAATIAVILIGANETTHVLKPLLGQHRPRSLILGIAPSNGSWPSGHATASMTLALCTVLAVPPRWRLRTAVMGALFSLAVTYSFLTLGWHYPSDAVAGFLVATLWTFLGVAGLSAYQARHPQRLRAPIQEADLEHELVPIAAGIVAAAGLVVAMVLARPTPVADYASGHGRFLVAVVAIAASALVLASWVLLILRRARR